MVDMACEQQAVPEVGQRVVQCLVLQVVGQVLHPVLDAQLFGVVHHQAGQPKTEEYDEDERSDGAEDHGEVTVAHHLEVGHRDDRCGDASGKQVEPSRAVHGSCGLVLEEHPRARMQGQRADRCRGHDPQRLPRLAVRVGTVHRAVQEDDVSAQLQADPARKQKVWHGPASGHEPEANRHRQEHEDEHGVGHVGHELGGQATAVDERPDEEHREQRCDCPRGR